MIAYASPKFAGVQILAQYGMNNSGANADNTSSNDRYYAIGATYNAGPLALYAAVDSTNYQTASYAADSAYRNNESKIDDSLTVTFGGNYDFGVTRLYAGVQYFEDVKLSSVGSLKALADTTVVAESDPLKGYAVSVSAKTPVVGGDLMVGVSYIDAETTDAAKALFGSEYDVSRIGVSAAYSYPLSKRSSIYGLAGYWRDSYDFADAAKKDADPDSIAVGVGFRTTF